MSPAAFAAAPTPSGHPAPGPGRAARSPSGSAARVADAWDQFAASHVRAARACFDWLATKADTEETDRCYALKGREFERRGVWQYKVTGGGRVWYARAADAEAVVILEVHAGHPKDTEPRRGR